MSDNEKLKHNLIYIINMLKNQNYTREEIIEELQKEYQRLISLT